MSHVIVICHLSQNVVFLSLHNVSFWSPPKEFCPLVVKKVERSGLQDTNVEPTVSKFKSYFIDFLCDAGSKQYCKVKQCIFQFLQWRIQGGEADGAAAPYPQNVNSLRSSGLKKTGKFILNVIRHFGYPTCAKFPPERDTVSLLFLRLENCRA